MRGKGECERVKRGERGESEREKGRVREKGKGESEREKRGERGESERERRGE